jgi:hypothetical protein
LNDKRNTTQQAVGGSIAASHALLSLIVLQCALLGCASWSSEKEVTQDVSLIAQRQLNPDSVVIETVLVRFPQSAEDELAEIWRLTNESIFDLDFRQRLDKNGLRAGVILGELPLVIRKQLQATAARQTTDALEHAGLAADVDNKMRQLQCRSGRRKDLIVKHELSESLTVLTIRDGGVSGETYSKASVLFDLRAVPHGDGRATVELTPEIQHGEHRQTFVSTEFGVRPEMRREQQVWKELKMELKLSPGQVLVVSCTMPPKSLGEAFFISKTAEQSEERVLLLLRLSETQLDELFAPDAVEQSRTMAER